MLNPIVEEGKPRDGEWVRRDGERDERGGERVVISISACLSVQSNLNLY
jgi:hypothetical protein